MKDIMVGNTITDGNKEYYIESKVSDGGFGIVYKASCDRLFYAVKVLKTDQEWDKISFRNEFNAALKVNSDHAVKYFYLNEDGQNDFPMFIIMEYAKDGSLCDDYNSRVANKRYYSTEELLNIFTQLIAGMIDISKAVVHRDIKLENILISNGLYKISDYGLAKSVGEVTRSVSKTMKGYGSELYYAPELWANPDAHGLNSTKVDIYAMGIVFYQLANLYYPYEDSSDYKAMHMYASVKSFRSELDSVFQVMIRKMLEKPIDDRYGSWEEINDYLINSSLGKGIGRDPFVDGLLKSELAKKSAADMKISEEMKEKTEKEENFLRLQNQIISKIYNPLKEIVEAFSRDSNSSSIALSAIDTSVDSERFSFEYESVDALSSERRNIAFNFEVPHSEIKSRDGVYRPVVGLTPRDPLYSGNGGIDYKTVDYRYCKNRILMWGTICADCGVGISIGILENPNDPLYGKVKMFYLIPLIEGCNFHFSIPDERLKKYCVNGFYEMRYDIKAEDFNFDEIKAMITMNSMFRYNQINDPIEQERSSFFRS